MTSSDTAILSTARNWLEHEKEILLITVAKTWGSSPRPIGSMMLIKPDGEFIGSVSGGCVEEDLISKYQAKKLDNKKVSMLAYGVGQMDAQKFGLPCGGNLELVVERLSSIDSLTAASEALKNDLPIVRNLNLRTGVVSYSEPEFNQCSSLDDLYLHKIFGPQWQLLVVGANELAKFVVEFATALNYKITVCDPREHINVDWLNENVNFTREMPDDVVAKLSPVERSIVLTLTHDPKMDDMALMQALTMGLFYVGAIGSHKTQLARRKRLQQLELTLAQINKLHGPVGLAIGSKTPAEIAISILAEITAKQHQAEKSFSKQTSTLQESA